MSFAMVTATVCPKTEEDFWDMLSYNPNYNTGHHRGVILHHPVVTQGDLHISKWLCYNQDPLDHEVPLVILVDEFTHISSSPSTKLALHQDQLMVLVGALKTELNTDAVNVFTMVDGNFLILFRNCDMDDYVKHFTLPSE
jgi:hypothetical protein